MPDRPPFLLAMADYYGTLAAVRCLGRAGIPVTVAEGKLLAPARWSRYVRRRVRCPEPSDVDRFTEWLVAFGRREPGHVLYPTSDDLAWLFALRRRELEPYFRLYQPDVGVLYDLLNKQRLIAACAAGNIATPRSVVPRDEADLEALAETLEFPVMLKPQTQVLFERHVKGEVVERKDELADAYRRFIRQNRYRPELARFDPGVGQPIIQRFHREAADHIYSLSGFVDESGALLTMRASVKVFQKPRRLGVGLCFDHAEVDPIFRRALAGLFQRVRYFGAFEVELIMAGGELLLIDFNPRFYGQMGFEIARGLPIPLLVYWAALGDRAALGSEVEASWNWRASGEPIYCNRLSLEVLLSLQRLSRRVSREEHERWRRWYAERRQVATDAVLDSQDLLPALVDAAAQLKSYLRHPRWFLRTIVLDR